MRGRLLTIVIAGFLIGALGGAAALVLSRDAANPSVTTSGKALIGGPFKLIDQHGKTVTDRDFRGRHMLIFFGFTHCPDICPAELQVISQSLDALGADADKVVPIFVTVDPERDTPEVMGEYVKNFGTRFVGLTGSPEAIAEAAKAYRVIFSQFEYKGQDGKYGYSVDHTTLAYLMSPEGEYVTHFNYGTPADKMTEALRRYL
jgi:protein SCO1/2